MGFIDWFRLSVPQEHAGKRGKCPPCSDPVSVSSASADPGQPTHTEDPIAEALSIIERNILLQGDLVIASSAGSDGELMTAANLLGSEHKRKPKDALLWYAYASALRLAMQSATALSEMKQLANTYPAFILAKFAIRGWEAWQSHFWSPPWSVQTSSPHPLIAKTVKYSILLATRDCLQPRASWFYRDTEGEIDARAIQSARIDLATVASPIVPQVVGIYARVFDNPSNPMCVEALGVPFESRGNKLRTAYEYLASQRDLDFVVLDNQDRVVCNRRLPLSQKMLEANKQLGERLAYMNGTDMTALEVITLCQRHIQRFNHRDIQF